jgi:predicted RNA-binding Zn-ribbon protein involved in translation (DUF1610 family)
MKCNNCGGKMIIMDKKHYRSFKDWKPQSYVCFDCGNVTYI